MYKNLRYFFYKHLMFINLIYTVGYWLLIIFSTYLGIYNIIYPKTLVDEFQASFKIYDNLLILLTTCISLIQITIALLMMLRLHIKPILLISAIIFAILAFIEFLPSIEIVPHFEYINPITIINHQKVIKFLIYLFFYLISLILYFKTKNTYSDINLS